MAGTRTEQDSMGPVDVPAMALWGASTQRAIANFPISGVRMPVALVRALARIKRAAAQANHDLGLLDDDRADLIARAAQEIIDGHLDDQFPLDCFQTGSGTSTNMNCNEVIANRAAQLAGAPVGRKAPVHPNDHVNRCQSSNDVFPTALHLAASMAIRDQLLPALAHLTAALEGAAHRCAAVVTIGRTHLQDAVPISLGQVLGGYVEQASRAQERAEEALHELGELPLGGTAVGTGVNRHPDFPRLTIGRLAAQTGLDLREASNHCEAAGARDTVVSASGRLAVIAVSLSRIASDLRLRACGPRCGFGELVLPEVQPGSSIMPGKVNPVIPEAVMQVAIQVLAHDAAIRTAALGGVGSLLELQVAMPVMARALLEAITLLAQGSGVFAERCIEGMVADASRCQALLERSLATVTALVPAIGYDAAAGVARRAMERGTSVRDEVLAGGVLPEAEIDRLLDPRRMLAPSTEIGDGGG